MQQINLYQPVKRAKFKPLSSVAIVLYSVILTIALGGWYGYELSKFAEVESELAAKKREKAVLLDRMTQLTKNSGSAPEKNMQLERRIASFKDNQNLKLKVIRSLKDPRLSNTTGFSVFFEGLSKQSLPKKLWLSEILIEQGGEHLMLKGGAMAPSTVPRFLQRLG